MISYLVWQFFNIVLLLMLIRCLLSWIPSVNWYREPFFSIRKFTDYVFEPFRRLIPPVGMLDISSIFAFIAVAFAQRFFVAIFSHIGI